MSVSIIKISTNTVVKTVGVGLGAVGVAITPNGSDAYFANYGSGAVSIIKTSTNTVVKTVHVGSRGKRTWRSPQTGGDAYVTNSSSGTVSIIKTSTNAVVKTVALGIASSPSGIAIT